MVIDDPEASPPPLSPKLRVVLALLAAHRGAVVSTDRLCDALWGAVPPPSAVPTLQSHLSRLRGMLAPAGGIASLDNGYRLELPDGGLDVDHFDRLADQARQAVDPRESADLSAAALAWWRGPAFGDLADVEWIRAEAVRLDELRLTATEEWVESRLRAGGDASLVGDLEGLTAANPLRERFLRQLMVAMFREGRQAEALRRAEEFRTALRDGMGLDPSPVLQGLEAQILAEDDALLGPRTPAPVTSGIRATVFDDRDRLVGRELDLDRIADALETAALVTLVGPGGVGKTRLARRVASTADRFEDGTSFIELAAVSDPASWADAAATALDVQPHQQLAMEDALLVALAERHQLVVLDNCEHLLETLVPFVDRARARCPLVHLLATSRQPLGLPGEVVLEVSPLPVGAPDVADPRAIAGAPAVDLLLERVRAVAPGFAITDANAPVLREICRHLDGVPLALELVAARFRSLDPETILQRLAAPAGALGARLRSADPRHRTLRDTIAWSFAQLSSAEKELFARLAVFAGSFELDAVESVCGDGPRAADGGGTTSSTSWRRWSTSRWSNWSAVTTRGTSCSRRCGPTARSSSTSSAGPSRSATPTSAGSRIWPGRPAWGWPVPTRRPGRSASSRTSTTSAPRTGAPSGWVTAMQHSVSSPVSGSSRSGASATRSRPGRPRRRAFPVSSPTPGTPSSWPS